MMRLAQILPVSRNGVMRWSNLTRVQKRISKDKADGVIRDSYFDRRGNLLTNEEIEKIKSVPYYFRGIL